MGKLDDFGGSAMEELDDYGMSDVHAMGRTIPMTRMRGRAPGSGKPGPGKKASGQTGRGAYRPSWATRYLLWVAGADPALLDGRVEYYRAVGMGVFVIIVALLGACTFSLYVAVITGRFEPRLLAFAAFWAVILFWLDRSILVDPHYGNLKRVEREADATPPAEVPSPWPPVSATVVQNGQQTAALATSNGHPPGPRAPSPVRRRLSWLDGAAVLRPLIYLSRVAIAVIVAILISEVVVLLIFRPEIQAQIRANQDSTYRSKLVALAVQQEASLHTQISNLNQRISANNATLAAPKSVMETAQANYLDELQGKTISGTPGFGPLAQQDLSTYENALTTYDDDVNQVNGENHALRIQITQLTEELSQYGSPSSAEFTALGQLPAGKQAYAETHGEAGWLDQENAFSDYQRASKGFAVHWIPWLIRALLVLIDLLPLGLKLLSSTSVYGRRVRDQGQLARYADRRLDRIRRADLDRGADLHDYRTGLAALLDYQRQERYRRDRIDHLGRSDGGFK